MTRHQRSNTTLAISLGVLLVSAVVGNAYSAKLGDGVIEPRENETAELARAVQNPVASLISLPFQNNTNFDFGPREKTQNVLNVQPVIPFSMTENLNLITRTIVPIISQPGFVPDQDRENGIGNTLFSAFFSPKDSGSWIWGAGPAIQLPTSSDDQLGKDEWAAGPSFVLLTMRGPWVIGSLFSNIWELSGDDDINFLPGSTS